VDWLADLPELSADRALDVATGSGNFARMLAPRCREVVGVDPAATAASEGNVCFQAMDAERLDFPDASFDLVAIAWSLHHLANPTRVLMEMHRVLKPGGTFLIIEPIRVWQGTNQDNHLAAHLLLARRDAAAGKPHFPIFERFQVGSIIQGLGLVDIDFQPLLADPAEADWDLEQCLEAGALWAAQLETMAADVNQPADWREEARTLAARIREEGIRTSPMMRTYGRVPAPVSAPV
jgi:SAM-dependent methyltransferase